MAREAVCPRKYVRPSSSYSPSDAAVFLSYSAGLDGELTRSASLHGSQLAVCYALHSPCYYSQHASKWDPAYANASYARIRQFDDGSIVVNISSSIGFGFVSAFVDEDLVSHPAVTLHAVCRAVAATRSRAVT